MNKSKDDDNKIGEESLHDVRVSSDTPLYRIKISQ